MIRLTGVVDDTAQFRRANTINLKTTKRQNTGDGNDRLISIENVNAGGNNDIVKGNKKANMSKAKVAMTLCMAVVAMTNLRAGLATTDRTPATK